MSDGLGLGFHARADECLLVPLPAQVDRVRNKELLLRLSALIHSWHAFDWPCFMVSAKRNSGVRALRGWLQLHARPGQWAAPTGAAHEQSPMQQATEIIRSAIFANFKQEMPYILEQRSIGWTELPNGDLRIDQMIGVPRKRKSTSALVRKRLPHVGREAREQLCEAFGRRVHLFLTLGTQDEQALARTEELGGAPEVARM